jgi:hypothetical protein
VQVELRTPPSAALPNALNIFFIRTSAEQRLSQADTCAVSSAASHNRDARVYVLSNSIAQCDAVLQREQPQVSVLRFRYEHAFANLTGLQEWHSAALWMGDFQENNLGNALRLALLFAYGGVYLDSDILTLRPLDVAQQNGRIVATVGLESAEYLNNAVLAFPPRHPFLHKAIENFLRRFKKEWGWNGPRLLTRVWRGVTRQYDGPVDASVVLETQHSGVLLALPEEFYPIKLQEAQLLNRPLGDSRALVDSIARSSRLLHMWNRQMRHHAGMVRLITEAQRRRAEWLKAGAKEDKAANGEEAGGIGMGLGAHALPPSVGSYSSLLSAGDLERTRVIQWIMNMACPHVSPFAFTAAQRKKIVPFPPRVLPNTAGEAAAPMSQWLDEDLVAPEGGDGLALPDADELSPHLVVPALDDHNAIYPSAVLTRPLDLFLNRSAAAAATVRAGCVHFMQIPRDSIVSQASSFVVKATLPAIMAAVKERDAAMERHKRREEAAAAAAAAGEGEDEVDGEVDADSADAAGAEEVEMREARKRFVILEKKTFGYTVSGWIYVPLPEAEASAKSDAATAPAAEDEEDEASEDKKAASKKRGGMPTCPPQDPKHAIKSAAIQKNNLLTVTITPDGRLKGGLEAPKKVRLASVSSPGWVASDSWRHIAIVHEVRVTPLSREQMLERVVADMKAKKLPVPPLAEIVLPDEAMFKSQESMVLYVDGLPVHKPADFRVIESVTASNLVGKIHRMLPLHVELHGLIHKPLDPSGRNAIPVNSISDFYVHGMAIYDVPLSGRHINSLRNNHVKAFFASQPFIDLPADPSSIIGGYDEDE